MKNYQITLQVPDNFDPEQLGIDLAYPEDIEIINEGEFNPDDYIPDVFNPKERDVVIFKFPADTPPETAQLLHNYLQAKFPDNKVIGLTNNVDFLIENADEAVKMLEEMIEKVKSASIRNKILQK